MVVSSHDSQIPEPELPTPSNPEPLYVPVEIKSVVAPELSQRHFPRLFEPSQPDSVEHSAAYQNPATSPDPSPEYPVAVQLQQLRLKAREEDRKQAERESTVDELPEDPSHAAQEEIDNRLSGGSRACHRSNDGCVVGASPGKALDASI